LDGTSVFEKRFYYKTRLLHYFDINVSLKSDIGLGIRVLIRLER